MKKQTKYNFGFTALEMLIVIGMMLVLMGLMLVGVTNSRERARDNVRVAAVHEVILALEQFHNVCTTYPPQISDTSELSGCPGYTSGELAFETFLPVFPKLPGDSEIFYAAATANQGRGSQSTCSRYQIAIELENEDAKALGEDDDAQSVTQGGVYIRCQGDSEQGRDFESNDSDLMYDLASYQ